MSCRPEHPHRQIAPGRLHRLPGQRAQVLAVAAAGIQDPQPRAEPGQAQDPARDAGERGLILPKPLPGTEVAVIGILTWRVQHHNHRMPVLARHANDPARPNRHAERRTSRGGHN